LNYSIILPHDVFTFEKGGAHMYDRFTKAIKEDYVCWWVGENMTAFIEGEQFNVPDSTSVGMEYIFKVDSVDSDGIVVLEWVGLVSGK